MAYVFVNQETGKATVEKQGSTTKVTIAGINTKTADADTFHRAMEIFMGIAGWAAGDMNRVVTEDVIETT